MDRIFDQLNIVVCIIAQVDSNDTLANLARVTHAISDVALNRLWYAIDSVILLARCMPPQYWKESIRSSSFIPIARPTGFGSEPDDPCFHFSQLDFTSLNREGDWLGQRFREYAARIRHLSIRGRSVHGPLHWPSTIAAPSTPIHPHTQLTSYISPQVIKAWQVYACDFPPLFCNMRHLIWEVLGELREPPFVFMVPSLTAFTLSTPNISLSGVEPVDRYAKMATVSLRAVLVSCPLLHTLVLTGPYATMLDISFVRSCQHISQLRAFSCDSAEVSNEFVRFAATLPHLEVFKARIHPDLSLSHVKHPFPRLHQLHLAHSNTSRMICLISAIASEQIQSMDLHVAGLDLAQTSLLLQAIGEHVSAQSLQRLTLVTFYRAHESYGWAEEQEKMASQRIQSIINIRHLKYFHLTVKRLTAWSWDVAHFMLRAWPELETMTLVSAIGGANVESAPLYGFVEAVVDRPKIQSILGFTVECDLDVAPPVSTTMLEHPRLQNVRFSLPRWQHDPSRSNDRTPILLYLMQTFPQVDFSRFYFCRD